MPSPAPFALYLCFSVVLAAVSSGKAKENGVYPSSEAIEKAFANFVDSAYAHLSDSNDSRITKLCRSTTMTLISLAQEGDENAEHLLNATGKPKHALTNGGLNFFGSYLECLESHIQSASNKVPGKYCLVEVECFSASHKQQECHAPAIFHPHRMKTIPLFGLCVPSSCDENDVELAVNQSWSQQFRNGKARVVSCSVKRRIFEDLHAIGAIIFFSFSVSLVLGATAYDMGYFKYRHSQRKNDVCSETGTSAMSNSEEENTCSFLEQCLLCFSLKRNLAKLLNTTAHSEKRNMDVLHGFRCLGAFGVIVYHVHRVFEMDKFFKSKESVISFMAPEKLKTVVRDTVTLDTFFFMSGLLSAYIIVDSLKRGRKFSIISLSIHRITRLTPLMLVYLIFLSGFGKYMTDSHLSVLPNWSLNIMMHGDWCRKGLWQHVVYLHNFINNDNKCFGHTWYVAADFQCYVVTLPILLFLAKNAINAYILMSTFFVISIAITFNSLKEIIASAYNKEVFYTTAAEKYTYEFYCQPFCHIGSYLIGILCGYLMIQKKELHLRKVYVMFLWLTFFTTAISLLFGGHIAHMYGTLGHVLYQTFARTVWSLGFFCLTVACTYGYGGFINDVLSWKGFVILSRLTYSAYVFHTMLIWPSEADTYLLGMIFVVLMVLVRTCAVAILLTLFYEMPFIALETAIRRRKTKKL